MEGVRPREAGGAVPWLTAVTTRVRIVHTLAYRNCQDLPARKEITKPPRLLRCTLRTRPHTTPGSSSDLNLDAWRLGRWISASLCKLEDVSRVFSDLYA